MLVPRARFQILPAPTTLFAATSVNLMISRMIRLNCYMIIVSLSFRDLILINFLIFNLLNLWVMRVWTNKQCTEWRKCRALHFINQRLCTNVNESVSRNANGDKRLFCSQTHELQCDRKFCGYLKFMNNMYTDQEFVSKSKRQSSNYSGKSSIMFVIVSGEVFWS